MNSWRDIRNNRAALFDGIGEGGIRGNDMDSSRGVLSGTMDRFKTVFETKSSRRMFTLVALFLIIY
ncbi:Bet1 SNARE 1 family protein [Salix suchowensis]|nr:Bet1 SNARE 1 family protein [Salix suchowensis]